MGSDAFVYDIRSRLTSATFASPSNAQSFVYDAYGSMTQKTTNATPLAYTVNTKNQVTAVGGVGVTIDARGNVTNIGSEVLSYDPNDRQTRHRTLSSDWTYLSTGAGERIAKIPGSSLVTRRQMARFIVEARGETPVTGCTNPTTFSDVTCSDPDWGHIERLFRDGISGGCGGGLYCPNTSIPRDQMATFLALGKYCPVNTLCPVGTVPSAPNPGWSDVLATNPHLPYINRIYADKVTAGCGISPLRYCPTTVVSRWEMMVFLAVYWPAYNPSLAPGSFYTLRNQSNQIATEYLDATVQRDNVYLGSLLVASKTPSGWEYYSSEHLGTPRRVTGVLNLNLKYWPYGDELTVPQPAQRLQFAAMERDPEGKRYYDHARSHDFNLGRFLSPDVLGGKPEDPQTWNRYAYARTNPIKYVDPDGKEFGYPGQQADLNQVLFSQLPPGSEICSQCDAGQGLGRDIALGSPMFPPEDIIAGGIAGLAKGFATRETAEGLGVRFTQDSVRSTFRHGEFADQSIESVAAGLRSGAIRPEALPVSVITRGGVTYALNSRSLTAFRMAGVRPVLRDVTGNPELERQLTKRLSELARRKRILVKSLPEIR